MTKEIAQRILQFLENTDLKGREMNDFVNCVRVLIEVTRQDDPKPSVPSNGTPSVQD